MASLPRILVIDDDPSFRHLIASLLKPQFDVTVAEGGEQGFQLGKTRPPHVALIDVKMPQWDGLATLQKFREHPELRATKIAMLTADAARQTVVTAIQNGADEYIVKTQFNKGIFLNKIEGLVAKSSFRVEEATPDHANVLADDNDPRLQELIDDWE